MIDFDKKCVEVSKMVQLLIPNLFVFGWAEFGGKGNGCWNPHEYSNMQDRKEEALMLAASKVAIPYGGQEHRLLSSGISKQIGCKYCTYPWIIQAVTYALQDLNYEDLEKMINFVSVMQNRMKKEE